MLLILWNFLLIALVTGDPLNPSRSSSVGLQNVQFPAGTINNQQAQLQVPASKPKLQSSALGAPLKVGPIGVNTNIEYQCTFYSNASYTCKTDCGDSDNMDTRSFPDAPLMKYIDRNCSTVAPIDEGVTWKTSYGFINKHIDPSRKNQIIATCAFYETFWYECYGVADCSRGEGITTCAGAAPWRGYYEGSPEKGTFRGNITAEAQYSGSAPEPMQPTPDQEQAPSVAGPGTSGGRVPAGRPVAVPVLPAAKKVVVACEKFVNSNAVCYGFDSVCSGPPEKQICSRSRKFLDRDPVSDGPYYNRFENVVSTIDEQNMSAADMVVNCVFYDNNEYLCSFPFAVNFKKGVQLPFRPATGSYYRSI